MRRRIAQLFEGMDWTMMLTMMLRKRIHPCLDSRGGSLLPILLRLRWLAPAMTLVIALVVSIPAML